MPVRIKKYPEENRGKKRWSNVAFGRIVMLVAVIFGLIEIAVKEIAAGGFASKMAYLDKLDYACLAVGIVGLMLVMYGDDY